MKGFLIFGGVSPEGTTPKAMTLERKPLHQATNARWVFDQALGREVAGGSIDPYNWNATEESVVVPRLVIPTTNQYNISGAFRCRLVAGSGFIFN